MEWKLCVFGNLSGKNEAYLALGVATQKRLPKSCIGIGYRQHGVILSTCDCLVSVTRKVLFCIEYNKSLGVIRLWRSYLGQPCLFNMTGYQCHSFLVCLWALTVPWSINKQKPTWSVSKWWNRELTLKCKLKCYVKPMKDPLGVSPSKENQGTTRGKEKILLTTVGIKPTTSGLDLPLLRRLSNKVGQRKSSAIQVVNRGKEIVRVRINVVPRSTMNTNGGTEN